jgi:hypothetical protein
MIEMDYSNVTFLLCLPRSRSAWLAAFVSPVATALHDPLSQCASIDELGDTIDVLLSTSKKPVFVADTAAVLFYAQIMNRCPGCKFMLIWRDPAAVKESLRQHGMSSLDIVDRCDDAIIQMLRSPLPKGRFFCTNYWNLDTCLRDILLFVSDKGALVGNLYIRVMRGKNIQVSLIDQEAKLDRGKVKKLFASIGITYN